MIVDLYCLITLIQAERHTEITRITDALDAIIM